MLGWNRCSVGSTSLISLKTLYIISIVFKLKDLVTPTSLLLVPSIINIAKRRRTSKYHTYVSWPPSEGILSGSPMLRRLTKAFDLKLNCIRSNECFGLQRERPIIFRPAPIRPPKPFIGDHSFSSKSIGQLAKELASSRSSCFQISVADLMKDAR